MSEVQAEAGAPPTPETAPETESSEKLFDPRKTFKVKIPSGEYIKECHLRFPSDDDWLERCRHVRLISRNLSRGRTESDTVGDVEAQADLFDELVDIDTTDTNDGFDQAEASYAIDLLVLSEKEESERTAKGLEIKIEVAGRVVTTHTLRLPTIKQRRAYDNGSQSVFQIKGGHTEIRIHYPVVARFYDELCVAAEGYPPGVGVPLVHKVAAVQVLNEELNELEATVDPLG